MIFEEIPHLTQEAPLQYKDQPITNMTNDDSIDGEYVKTKTTLL